MDRRSRRIAQMGVGDLRMTLAHILLFSPEIGEADLLIHTGQEQEELRFRRGMERGAPGGLRWQEIVIGTQSRTFITLQRDGITLAAEWSEASGFQPVRPEAPRLYVGFPLVGSEQFPFPMVLNSLALRPNEPRSGISLVEHEESLDGRVNRELLDRAGVGRLKKPRMESIIFGIVDEG